jgi:putative phosphoribosyl transferase
MLFEDRRDAGKRLAAELAQYTRADSVVLALPRGGVAVGYEVAVSLGMALEVLLSRKIGAPGNPELAIGAVAEIDGLWLDQPAMEILGVSAEYVRGEAERRRREIDRMIQVYRRGRPLPALEGRTVIVVDDGIATGYTMLAAAKGVRETNPGELVVAVPVAPQEALLRLSREADRTVCLVTPEPFYAVGYHYVAFDQLSDEDVVRYLEDAKRRLEAGSK